MLTDTSVNSTKKTKEVQFMDALINVRIENDRMITDSRNVADVFSKKHKHVLDSIRALEKDVPNFRLMFFEGEMPDSY